MEKVSDQAWFSTDGEDRQPLNIAEALARFRSSELSRWDALFFGNSEDETLVIQQETAFWSLHYFAGREYQFSYAETDSDTVARSLEAFLRQEDWTEMLDDAFRLDEWTCIYQSESEPQVDAVLDALTAAGIPGVLRTVSLGRFNAIFGTYHDTRAISVFVPEEHLDAAYRVLPALQQQINELFREASHAAGENNSQKELEIYQQLARLAPDERMVFFNLGVLLYNARRYEEAAQAFMEAVNADDRAMVDESVFYLEQLAARLPANLEILHTLANAAAFREDDIAAEKYYRKILDLDPNDPETLVNLAYLYTQNDFQLDKARDYFRRYLELNPDAPDREAIAGIIASLRETQGG